MCLRGVVELSGRCRLCYFVSLGYVDWQLVLEEATFLGVVGGGSLAELQE